MWLNKSGKKQRISAIYLSGTGKSFYCCQRSFQHVMPWDNFMNVTLYMQKYKQSWEKRQFPDSLSFRISWHITRSSNDNEVIKVLLQALLTLPASVVLTFSLSLLFSPWLGWAVQTHPPSLPVNNVYTPVFQFASEFQPSSKAADACSPLVLLAVLSSSVTLTASPCSCGSVKEMLNLDSSAPLHSCHVSTHIPGLVWPK